MTDEQEKVLVETVERLTVIVQLIDWQALSKRYTDTGGVLNNQMCDAFPWLVGATPSVEL